MIEEQLFKKHFVGRDGFVWWIGQIVDQSKWQDNIEGRRIPNSSGIPGFGERFKVRIMGYHTHNLKDLTDDELPWATVMYPVTAGAGSGGASTSSQLRQGNFVFGFFIDGEDAQQPVIMGVLGFNEQTSLEKKVPEIGFLPFSGYTTSDKVPVTNIKTSNEGPPATQVKTPGTTRTQEKGVVNSTQGATSGLKDLASEQQLKDGKLQTPMAQLNRCGLNDTKGITADIQTLIAKIENLTKLAGDYTAQLTGRIDKIQKRIQQITGDITQIVTQKVKNIVEGIRKNVIERINTNLKDTFYLFFPNKRPAVKEAVNKVLEGIGCAFNKIIGGLVGLVGNLISDIPGKVVNAPLCFAENITANLLGKVAGFISGTVDSILGPVNALLSTVGSAVSLAGSILSLLKKFFGFFSCEDQLSCPGEDQWSIWDGAGDNGGPIANLQGMFSQAQSIGSQAVEAATDLAGAFNPDAFSFDLNISDIVNESSCNTGPEDCGPPSASFIGALGLGADTIGNVVVGSLGEVLAVDIVRSGSGYFGAPKVSIKDNCGIGEGAAGEAIMVPASVGIGTTSGDPLIGLGVSKVIITDPGANYLPAPDGSEGGMNRVWKKKDQTYVKTVDGTYLTPIDPGTVIDLNIGDIVKVPARTIGFSSISSEKIIPARVKYIVEEPLTITTPKPSSVTPDVPVTYPVILELDEVYVKDSGFNYSPGDKIVMNPSNGAVLKPTIRNGAVVKIEIEKVGRGWDSRPEIYVETDTGFNAEFIPVFKPVQIDPEEPIPPGAKVISVVDCVGKIGSDYK